MKTDDNGFKTPEKDDPVWDGVRATFDNTVLLYEMIKSLQMELKEVKQKLDEIQWQ